MKDPALFKKVKKLVFDAYNDVSVIMKNFGINEVDAELERSDYNKAREKSAVGDYNSRMYLINANSKILKLHGYYKKDAISKLINFDDFLDNDDDIILEALLLVNDMSYYLETYKIGIGDSGEDFDVEASFLPPEDPYDFAENFSSRKLREIVVAEWEKLDKFYTNSANRIKLLAIILYTKEYGRDCIDSLSYQNISEVAITKKDYIYIVHKGIKIWLSFLSFPAFTTVENIQKKATKNAKSNFEEANPSVITSMLNSSRVTAAGYSMTPTKDATYYNERIFNLKMISLEQMRDEYKTINDFLYKLLTLNQRGRGAYLVSGSDMGVGKTTFLTAVLGKTPKKWGLGILDPQNEMQINDKFPWLNVNTLVESPNRSIKQCFEIMLKQARDVLCVSEIAGADEMGELINAARRLNSGVGGTIHSYSPEELVSNCRNLLTRTDMYTNDRSAERDIARSLDLVFHMARLPDSRIVLESVSEIVYVDNDFYASDSLLLGDDYTNSQKLGKTLDLLQMKLAKELYDRPYKVNRLVQFDRKALEWEICGTPSTDYFNKMEVHLGEKQVEYYHNMFTKKTVMV